MSAFVDSLLDLLSPLGGVTARRMFGGYGIYKEGLMFGLVAEDRFYLRTDELTKERFEDQGCEPFVFGISKSGKPVVSKYFEPPEAAFANEQRMKTWARLAWECAQRSAVEKAAKQGARKRSRKAGDPPPSKKRPPRKKPSAD
jgi:DNA transformation protein